jgi:acyl-coenzyme A thioesterase 13
MADENEQARKRINAFIAGYAKAMPDTNFDQAAIRNCTCTSAQRESDPGSTAKATFEMTPQPEYINNPNTKLQIHGGAVATFLDNLTSVSLIASKRYFGQGVSRNLRVDFLRPLLVGERVIVEAEILHIGKRVATVRGTIKRKSDGTILAICTQEKLNPDDTSRRVHSL